MRKIVLSLFLIFNILFSGISISANSPGDLDSRLRTIINGNPGTYRIGIENYKSGEKIYINNGSIYAASVIKVFVMMSVYRQVNEGKIKLNSVVKLQNREIERVGGTGILQGKPTGYKISIAKLIEYMIVYSDNRAANILTDLLGFEYINNSIKWLGCSDDTNINDYFNLYPAHKGKTKIISTLDLNIFLKRIYKKTCISPIFDDQMVQFMKKTENRKKLVAKLPKDAIVAHKTGSNTNFEHDSGIVFSRGGDFAISILVNAPNGRNTENTIASIARETYDYFNGK